MIVIENSLRRYRETPFHERGFPTEEQTQFMREGENDRQNNNKSKERQISRWSAVSILAAVAGGTNNGTELVKRERV